MSRAKGSNRKTKRKKKVTRKSKVSTKTIVLEVETSASAATLRKRTYWTTFVRLFDRAADVRQVTVQVADATK